MRLRQSIAALIGAVVVLNTDPAAAVVGPSTEGGSLAAYTVMILKRAPGGASFCTGVVVARNAILTAGHCVSGVTDTRVHFRDAAGQPVLLSVTAVAVHPQYRNGAAAKRERSIDLALVRTTDPLPARFTPATLDAGAPVAVGTHYRLAGYGVAREGAGATSGTLRTGVLAARAPLSTILLWADDPQQRGLGACEGDSGAPIFADGNDTLVAIVDWAAGNNRRGCGGLTQGALVAPQRGWIASVLSRWGVR